MSNSLSYHYGKNVKAIDVTKKAIKLAKEVSISLNQDVQFLHRDIFTYEDTNLYDLVISLGVLHHTSDCKLAFKKLSVSLLDKDLNLTF